jgi:hypothetical protein
MKSKQNMPEFWHVLKQKVETVSKKQVSLRKKDMTSNVIQNLQKYLHNQSQGKFVYTAIFLRKPELSKRMRQSYTNEDGGE